jgi:hypothetical protein
MPPTPPTLHGVVFDISVGGETARATSAVPRSVSAARRVVCDGTTRHANHQKPVQPSCEKYSTFAVGQITDLSLPVAPITRWAKAEGVIRHILVRRVGRNSEAHSVIFAAARRNRLRYCATKLGTREPGSAPSSVTFPR